MIQIERVELRLIQMPLVAPFETSFGVEEVEDHIIVRVDGGGLTGWGECVAASGPWYSYETNQTAWHVLRDFLIPLLWTAHLERPQDFPTHVHRVRGHKMAKAGLEAALWDWYGKSQGKSLAQLFGAERDRIPVGVSVGLQPTTAGLVKRVGQYLQEGYTRIKIKIKPGRDVELVRALRAEFPHIRLQVDANSAFHLADAPVFKAMDEYGLLLIEQPLSNDDIYQHSKLQREVKTPLCLDESIHTVEDAEAALELGSCRIINIKPGRVGGFTESIKIHDLCARLGAPVWCGGMLESGIGRAGNVALAALPNFTLPGDISASRRYYREDLVAPEFEIDAAGMMRVPAGQGIGVEVVQARLEKLTQQQAEYRNG
ncbi:MAG: o-succinylbenzoate synthase [Anaerolineae bacterium]